MSLMKFDGFDGKHLPPKTIKSHQEIYLMKSDDEAEEENADD